MRTSRQGEGRYQNGHKASMRLYEGSLRPLRGLSPSRLSGCGRKIFKSDQDPSWESFFDVF